MARTRKLTLEELLDHVRVDGPKCVRSLRTRLSLERAESLCLMLKEEGIDVAPYDFPSTLGVWQATNPDGIPYRHLATKQLIQHIADQNGVDYKTLQGFKRILPQLTENTFQRCPINPWGTTLMGMFNTAYSSSPSLPVLDVVKHDEDFIIIKNEGLRPYDFNLTPRNAWLTDKDVPSDLAREATKRLIHCLAKDAGLDYRLPGDFKKILPHLIKETFQKYPINFWGTTIWGMLACAYSDSPSSAVLDLIEQDDDFKEVIAKGLRPYDFYWSPPNTWISDDETPSDLAREATKRLIVYLAEKECVDYRTSGGFQRLLPHFTVETFKKCPINFWGTTPRGMLDSAYSNSPSSAVLDLIESDDDFSAVRDRCLKAYDFPITPRKTWLDEEGRPTTTSREATKQVVIHLAEKSGVDYRTPDGFKKILGQIDTETFLNCPINYWGTTCCSMLRTAYSNSPSAAVLDLIESDDDFSAVRDRCLKAYDFPMSSMNTWQDKEGRPTNTSREATKQLIIHFAEKSGVDYRTPDGFKVILPQLTVNAFRHEPINFWGTTLRSILNIHSGSPSSAVYDLVQNDPDFKTIKESHIVTERYSF